MRMACILIGSYYVLCIPHILMASLYQGILPFRGGASLSLIMVSSCHAIDIETEAHTYKTEHDDQKQCLVQVGKPLYMGCRLVNSAHLGKLSSGSHVSLIAFLVFGIVLVGHLLTNVLTRELVTAGQLKRVPRTDNNPHGLLIVNWRTLLNKDIDQKTKSNY